MDEYTKQTEPELDAWERLVRRWASTRRDPGRRVPPRTGRGMRGSYDISGLETPTLAKYLALAAGEDSSSAVDSGE